MTIGISSGPRVGYGAAGGNEKVGGFKSIRDNALSALKQGQSPDVVAHTAARDQAAALLAKYG